jgi:hypothetical protein
MTKSSFIKGFGAALLVVASVIFGVFLFEVLSRLFLPSLIDDRSRSIFWEGRGTIFQNQGDIFTYVPHNDIRARSGYSSGDNFTVEFDYRFQTNNLGLVQDTDVVPDRDSLLLLGDSFTEGQGAEPWFRLVRPEIEKLGYQAVNGGLMGTGFEQWLKLDRYLQDKKIRIRKVVVVFISHDYKRPVFNFSPETLTCLSAPPGQRSEACLRSRLGARAKALLPATYQIYQFLKAQLALTSSTPEYSSDSSIAELINLHGANNVVFIHLPQRDELSGPHRLGLHARRSIEEAGGTLIDGFKSCHLTESDYYLVDLHPNTSGYAKIAACVTSAIRQVAAKAQ